MSAQYDNYLKQHRENVSKGFLWVADNLPGLLPVELAIGKNQVFLNHDESKYDFEEYDAYDAYFYGGNRSFDVVQNFKRAWLRHIHENPHHWQHWVLIGDDPKESEICLEMPYNYILEMICDWWSFSWASGNLEEIFKWYDEHKDYIKLNEKTRKTVESILAKIKEKLTELKGDSKVE